MSGKSKRFIRWLAEQMEERRSDVADVCNEFLDTGKIPEGFQFEHRFVKAKLPNGTAVEYDTLTTEIAYSLDGENFWQCEEHEYVDK